MFNHSSCGARKCSSCLNVGGGPSGGSVHSVQEHNHGSVQESDHNVLMQLVRNK